MTYPANEILLLNPRRKRSSKKRATKKRATKKRATKRTTRRTTTTTRRTTTRRNPRRTAKGRVSTMAKRRKRRTPRRRNPSPRRRAVAKRVRSSFAGLNFRAAFKNVPLGVIGMFATKWAAKRGTPDALESDPSTWSGMTYVKGGLGAAVAGWGMNMIKPGSGQKVLEGGLMLLGYKAAQNHIVPKNTFLTNQFGFGQEGAARYLPGDVETNDAGEPFILGQDGQTWIPMGESEDDSWEMMGQDDSWEMMGQNALETPGRLGFGDVLETPGRLGFGESPTQGAYAKHLFEN